MYAYCSSLRSHCSWSFRQRRWFSHSPYCGDKKLSGNRGVIKKGKKLTNYPKLDFCSPTTTKNKTIFISEYSIYNYVSIEIALIRTIKYWCDRRCSFSNMYFFHGKQYRSMRLAALEIVAWVLTMPITTHTHTLNIIILAVVYVIVITQVFFISESGIIWSIYCIVNHIAIL